MLIYASSHGGPLVISPYLRAIDHMENCISAIHRAVLNAQALQANKIGRSAPRLTSRQDERLAYLRNAIEHSNKKLLGEKYGKSPAFDKTDPYSLRLANTSMVIGKNVLTYKELVSVMTKCYRTIEVIRGVPTGTPGPAFPKRPAADRSRNPGSLARGHDAIQLPPGDDPAGGYPLLIGPVE